jgi:putative copper export protein
MKIKKMKIKKMKIKKMKIKKMILQVIQKAINKNSLIQSFSLPFILSNLNINVPENASSLTNVSYGVFLLSLIALFCFINIIGFFTVYILVLKGDYENKYPRFKRYINYYKKGTILSLVIEIIFCFISLLLLVVFSFLFVSIGIK